MSGQHHNGSSQDVKDHSLAPAHESRASLSSYATSTAPLIRDDKSRDSNGTRPGPSSQTGSKSPAPASAARVDSVMGPPPPKDEKKPSFWRRWQQDRKDAREMGMPQKESSKKWGVGYVTS